MIDILKLFDENTFYDNVNIPIDIKKEIYKSLKSFYYNYFGFTEDYKDVNTENYMILNSMDNGNVSDAFVRGRYGHLDDYQIDSLKLIKCLHAVRGFIEKEYGLFTISNGINGNENASSIRMVKPDINSKLYIFNSNLCLDRVYKYTDYYTFLNEAYLFMEEKAYRELDIEYSDKITINDYEDKNYIIIPEYGISSMINIMKKHSTINNVLGINLVQYDKNIYIEKGKGQIICITEEGNKIMYFEGEDGIIRKLSCDLNQKIEEKISEYEKCNHPMNEEIAKNVLAINLDETKQRIIENQLKIINFNVNLVESQIEQEKNL